MIFDYFFGKYRPTKINTEIAEDVCIVGGLQAKGTVRVDGRITGNVEIMEGALIVGSEGRIDGNISAYQVLIGGTVNGNVHAEDEVEVTAEGRLHGDVTAQALIIDEKAHFKGQSNVETVEEEDLAKAEDAESSEAKPETKENETEPSEISDTQAKEIDADAIEREMETEGTQEEEDDTADAVLADAVGEKNRE